MVAPPRNPELEAAAFADFDDADAWRVYADWLEARGDVRGEIIGLELHRATAFLAERPKLRAKVRALEAELDGALRQSLAARGLEQASMSSRRGFAVELRGPAEALAPHLEDLFAEHPIQRLLLDGSAAAWAPVFADPSWTNQVTYLRLSGVVGHEACERLAELDWPRLRRLNLLNTSLEDAACPGLAALRTERLEALTLTANRLSDRGLEVLLDSPTRSQWRELYLANNALTEAAVALIVGATELDALEQLSLREMQGSFAAFAPLVDPQVLPNLRRLETFGDDTWRHLPLRNRLRERFGRGLA